MIGDSVGEVLLIRASVLALRAVIPLSFGIVAGATAYGIALGVDQIPVWALIISSYALCECLFFLAVYLPVKNRVVKLEANPPSLSRSERGAILSRCLTSLDDPEDFLRGWFYGAPLEQIKKENIREWLTEALFASQYPPPDDAPGWGEESDQYIETLERIGNWSIPLGHTPDLPMMRLTVDPVHVVARPLLWYIIVAVLDGITHAGLSFAGLHYYATPRWFESFPPRSLTTFSRRTSRPNLSYWHRPHKSSVKKPIIFIHGIGIGLFAYVPLIRDIIRSDKDVGLFVVEVLPISMRMALSSSRPQFTPQAFCDDVDAVLHSHNLGDSQFVLLAHSYGTFLAAHLLQHPRNSHPNTSTLSLSRRIGSVILLDPITFLLFHPTLTYNFVYRKPGRWRANEWMIWYFTSRDIGIAALLARGFFWTGGVMWREDLLTLPGTGAVEGWPHEDAGRVSALVMLSGRDQIIAAPRVWAYLTGEPSPVGDGRESPDLKETLEWHDETGRLRVVMHTQLDHAQVLVYKSKYAPIIEHLNSEGQT